MAAEPAETVTVTATHDGSALGSATVTIAANEAVVSTATVSAVSSPVTEGAAAEFEVRLDAAALAALSVSVTVSETASMLSGAAPAVTFAVGESQKTVSLATTDDTVVEADSDVTLSILPGGGYTAGAASSAAVTVLDDDAAIFGVSASPEEIDEGGSATLTVSIANGVTFAEAQSIALSVAGSASAADYGLAPETLTLAAGATSVTATLTAVDDADEESAETATVTATHGGTAVGSATLTIRASDIPSDDASLASLVLSDVDIGTFSPEATDYAAQVPSELSSTTVTVAASDAGAVLEIADAVGSTLGETRTVRLEEGDNAITLTVTAEDGATTRTYRVAVTRAYRSGVGRAAAAAGHRSGRGGRPDGSVVGRRDAVGHSGLALGRRAGVRPRRRVVAAGARLRTRRRQRVPVRVVVGRYDAVGVGFLRWRDGAPSVGRFAAAGGGPRRRHPGGSGELGGRPGCGRTVRRCGWRTIRRGRRSRTGCRTSRGWRRRRSASVATAIG